jgi:cell division protein FtsQ
MQSLSRAAATFRRDPAPSRWSYRLQRLWLTPAFRWFIRLGLPVLILMLAAFVYLADSDRRAAFWAGYEDVKSQVQNRPEFMVGFLAIDGASPELTDAVRARMSQPLPISRFELDLDAIRQQAESLDAVESALVRVATGGVLQVTLTERTPAFVWRSEAGLILIDATGHRIAGLADRADRADLPLLAGAGADGAVSEALAILRAAGPLGPRLRALVRVSDRRWTLVLDRDQSVLLPHDDPVGALEGLIALNQAQDILSRDLLAIDLRNPRRPVLRLAPYALEELRRGQGIVTTEQNL